VAFDEQADARKTTEVKIAIVHVLLAISLSFRWLKRMGERLRGGRPEVLLVGGPSANRVNMPTTPSTCLIAIDAGGIAGRLRGSRDSDLGRG
jgi:hypothetical protein